MTFDNDDDDLHLQYHHVIDYPLSVSVNSDIVMMFESVPYLLLVCVTIVICLTTQWYYDMPLWRTLKRR